MNTDKIYWSTDYESDWCKGNDWMTFFLIPRRFWSFKAWKLAFLVRNSMLAECMKIWKHRVHEEERV